MDLKSKFTSPQLAPIYIYMANGTLSDLSVRLVDAVTEDNCQRPQEHIWIFQKSSSRTDAAIIMLPLPIEPGFDRDVRGVFPLWNEHVDQVQEHS